MSILTKTSNTRDKEVLYTTILNLASQRDLSVDNPLLKTMVFNNTISLTFINNDSSLLISSLNPKKEICISNVSPKDFKHIHAVESLRYSARNIHMN